MRTCVLFLVLLVNPAGKAQDLVDSVRALVLNAGNDSAKTMTYFVLAHNYYGMPAKALEIASDMTDFCEKIKNKKDKAFCLRKIGIVYHQLNFFDKSLEYTFRSAKLFDELNDRDGLGNCYNNIANSYKSKGELTNDNMLFDRAIEYHEKCIAIRNELNDSNNVKNSYNNLALVYMAKKEYDKAIEYLTIPYEFFKRIKTDPNGIDMTSTNLGDAWLRKAKAERKPEYFRKSLAYFTERLNSYREGAPAENYAVALQKVGDIYLETGQADRALDYLLRAHKMNTDLGDMLGLSSTALLLSSLYQVKGDYKLSNEYLNVHLNAKDSLLNQRNKSNADQLQAIYQASQKDKEIEKLNNDKKLKDAELNRQRTIIFSSVGGLLLILLLGFVLLSRYNLKKKANHQLSKAYEKIELKNRQITDSINYAKRIQSAILPPSETIEQKLNNFFIFYRPRDIVSGDFYWYSNHNGKLFFVVGDCTGHGVPGALMSMIGNTLLNEIINQKNISDPGTILEHLHAGVTAALRQQDTDKLSQDDGMDVTVCCIDENNPMVLKYATANHSLFVKNSTGLAEFKGDIYSIGGNFDNAAKKFSTHSITLEKGDFIVLSTDGYYDQFGGENNRKFLVSRFEKLLVNTDLSKENVAESFRLAIDDWKGEGRQTDDILVAGFSV
jgi:serine phosphatase RsbU (regulator of sigma subunit)